MEPTPISLLERLGGPAAGPAWDRFVLLYTPLLYLWASRLGILGPDADDIVQDVFTTLVQALPGFRYDPDRRFRGWLWTVTRNKARERARRQAVTVAADPFNGPGEPAATDPAEEADEREYRDYLTRRALELIRADFEPPTWQAFWQTVALGRPAPEVAAELGLSPNAVYLAKGRVLRRLRVELAGLLD
jgi:RNA polymerase sigma-70 factor (ECF subfamily)